MSRTLAVLSVVVVAVGSACMGARGSRAAAPPQQAQRQTQDQTHAPGHGTGMMAAMCPMTVPGTQVAASDTPDGEAITFTTASPEQVTELRRRVHAMADMHDRHEEHAGMHAMPGDASRMHDDAGPSGMGGMSGMGSAGSAERGAPPMEMPPASRAIVEDVDGGARVLVTPEDPGELERLRSAIRSHADHMRDTGTCGMGPPSQDR
jgi:hypothetical protein